MGTTRPRPPLGESVTFLRVNAELMRYHSLVALTQLEFDTLLAATKAIHEDIDWTEDEDHSPSVEFSAEVTSDAGYPLFVRGRSSAAP
jgi:hypothetical protein